MQFKFEANQEFQVEAIESIVGLFAGQSFADAYSGFTLGESLAAIANRVDLDETRLLENLSAIQDRNGIERDHSLILIEQDIQTAAGSKPVRFPNFSIEMETGTGKTYVYLRTALELFRRYGLRKFIVVVPSVAVREGVLKTLEVTGEHLRALYDNLPYRYYVYDSDSLSQVRQFALSDSVELMIMTIDSFNKSSNVIRQSTDRLQGETPIHLIQAARPVLILDEPQNMESELRVKALSALDPILALRYSATHRNPYNLAYRLTPFEAYRQNLVKRIEVASVIKEDDANQVYLRLDGISVAKKTITARLAIHKLMKSDTVKEAVVTVKPGDSLEEKSGRKEYSGFDIDEINPGGGFVRFANNLELRTGESRGADREALFEAQIRYTIEEHFRKQAKLRDAGIKVLSLFFIDRVDNYAPADGLIRRQFVRAFNEIKAAHPTWKHIDAERVQASYFAQKRSKGGETETLDSISGKTKEDEAAYDLIMKDKERLLSFEEPVAFIFSHSALREGWDNPNVFQICTLNQTASEVKKRQEVGRGVRLSVDQSGSRIKDERVNVLTVVANESYERYVERLQSEIEEEYGPEGRPPRPANARKRATVRLRKECRLRPEFKELWERIKHKTRYAVKIDTEALITDVVAEVDKLDIRPPRVTVAKAQIQVVAEGPAAFTAAPMTSSKTALYLTGQYPLPNLVEIMADLMDHANPPIRLTRATLLQIYKRTKKQKAALDNPQEFAMAAIRVVKEQLAEHLVSGIQYQKIGAWYEMAQLEDSVEEWLDYLVPVKNSLYDHVAYDSDVEKEFVRALEARDDVRLYWKLPGWFRVSTPVGDYNPDWAIVMEDRDAHGRATGKPLLYLVRETKGDNWRTDLRPDERRKIKCGERHFTGTLGVDYKVVSKVGELP